MKLFQRTLSVLLLICLVFSLAACGKPQAPAETTAPTEPAAPPVEKVLVDTAGMTELQKAIVVTAESYCLRGKYAQYDQYSLTKMPSKNVNRRLLGIMAPEDYTSQYYGYTDCSSFVYDVYKFALGMSISSPANTKTYCAGSPHAILTETPISNGFANMTAEELSAKEKAFRETLQPGDIIAYRAANGNSGHAMLYVGNNMMLHSSGSTYDFTTGTDKVEKNGTYLYESINILFSGGRRHLFDKSIYVILRPLNKFEGTIPDHTLQRMGGMRGIVVEKLCSHTYGQTVSPGGTLTYTFRIKNNTSRPVTLAVADTLPADVTYVSGAEAVADNTLSWYLTVANGATESISYTVQVKETTPTGTFIQSESTVGGVPVKCPRIQVAKTLTDREQQAVLDAQKELDGGELKGIALANAIYEKVCGKTAFTQQTIDAMWDNLVLPYNTDAFLLDSKKPLTSLVAPRLYGGKLMAELDTNAAATQYRTRLVTKNVLMIGDIVLADNALYMFTGVGLYDLIYGGSGLQSPESLLTYDRFVVLRPSMAF
ncbi:MAG: C40 family peptidase [Oscillospiraceae bacterium]|nr:C40 family peptidase [Oscillospiraceae bacterium]